MITAVFTSGEAEAKFQRIQLAIASATFDEPVERTAWVCYRELVQLTPKKWTGITRRSWQVSKPAVGQRLVSNKSKIMLFLEKGTGNAGTPTSHGGYIYPKTKRVLFVALNSRAMFGYQPGMKFGKDFVLARRVRGIVARKIVENYRPKAAQHLREAMQAFLEKVIK